MLETVDANFCVRCKASGLQLCGLLCVYGTAIVYGVLRYKTEICLHLKKPRCLKIALKLFKFSCKLSFIFLGESLE